MSSFNSVKGSIELKNLSTSGLHFCQIQCKLKIKFSTSLDGANYIPTCIYFGANYKLFLEVMRLHYTVWSLMKMILMMAVEPHIKSKRQTENKTRIHAKYTETSHSTKSKFQTLYKEYRHYIDVINHNGYKDIER